MLGQAAPFLGQGGIDPRMVSGPSSDFMTQMASLPIQGMGGGGFQGYGVGSAMPFQGGQMPGGGYGGMSSSAPRMPGSMFGGGGPGPQMGGQFPGQSDANRMGGQWGSGIPSDALRAAVGGMPNGSGMGQPFQPMTTASPGGGDDFIRRMIGNPVANGPGGRQTQPFQPQGPGQQVTAEQLAARGLNPQEIQRRLQQFAGGQLGWQGQQGGQGGRGGMVDPTTGQPVDPSSFVDNRLRRMTGNPTAYDPTRRGIRQMMPQQNPRQGVPRPPAGPDYGNDMIARPIPPDGPGYGNDMISRQVPQQRRPMQPWMQDRVPGYGGAGGAGTPRADRTQNPRMGRMG